jgi:hypothetical protein
MQQFFFKKAKNNKWPPLTARTYELIEKGSGHRNPFCYAGRSMLEKGRFFSADFHPILYLK